MPSAKKTSKKKAEPSSFIVGTRLPNKLPKKTVEALTASTTSLSPKALALVQKVASVKVGSISVTTVNTATTTKTVTRDVISTKAKSGSDRIASTKCEALIASKRKASAKRAA